jgi:hypothetical protein
MCDLSRLVHALNDQQIGVRAPAAWTPTSTSPAPGTGDVFDSEVIDRSEFRQHTCAHMFSFAGCVAVLMADTAAGAGYLDQ